MAGRERDEEGDDGGCTDGRDQDEDNAIEAEKVGPELGTGRVAQ